MASQPKAPEQPDPIAGTVFGNVLDQFDNVAYNLKLYMIPPVTSSTTATVQNYRSQSNTNPRQTTSNNSGTGSPVNGGYVNGFYRADPQDTVVLAQTGVSGNQIDNLQIVAATGKGGSFITSTVNFDVIQPGAADFIDQIMAAKAKIGAPIFANDVPIFLEIVFKGYTEDLDNPDAESEPVTIAGPFVYPLIISKINLEIDGNGSTYNFECVHTVRTAYNDEYYRLPATLTCKGKTISEYVDQLQTHLDDYREEHNTDYSIKDIVKFDVSDIQEYLKSETLVNNLADKAEDINRVMNPELKDATPDEYEDILSSNSKDEGNLDILVEDDQITFREGVTIDNFFATILSMSDDFFQITTRTEGADDPVGERKINKGMPFVKWFKVNSDVKALGYDNKRNRYAREITYKLVIYNTDGSQVQADAKENTQLSKEETKERFDGMSIFKSYHYLFTGRNDQIINCRIAYDAGHALLTAPARGAGGDFSTSQASNLSSSVPINEDLTGETLRNAAKQAVAKEEAKALIDGASSNEIRSLGQTLGLSDKEIKDAQSDKSSDAARILKNVLSNQQARQAIEDAQTARQRTTQSDNIRNADGGTYSNQTSGFLYSEDIIDVVSERISSATKLETARNMVRDQRAEFKNNAKSLTTSAKKTHGDEDNRDPGDSAEPAVQQMHITNPAEAATYDGSPRNTIFGYLMQQHGSTNFLVTLDMEIKGDPWYLGSPALTGYGIPGADERDTTSEYAVYTADENYALFEMQTPRRFDFDVEDEDNNTGYWEPAGTAYFISGVYRIIRVASTFSNGQFTQEVNFNKLTPLKISMLDKAPQNTAE